jgi:Carboxypeptidase regulatory-like domain
LFIYFRRRIGMRFISRTLLSLVLVIATTAAWAGETGSISGVVKDGSGLPVPGATVKVSGPQMPAGYTTVSRANGTYAFPKLLPGAYTVEGELKGLGKVARKLNISVDTDYQIELVLVQTAAAEVVVTGVNAEVDKKSTEVNSNFVEAEVRSLPIARNYSGLINLIPGASADTGTGAVAVGGGTREENKYLIDGVNITNVFTGSIGLDTNELDIADVNIKRASITAEFGRTSGVIVNAVTKSGTNEIKGTVRVSDSPASFASGNNQGVVTRDTDTYNGSVGVGFPIVKDTLFGYASGRYAKTKTSGLSSTLGGVTYTQPDGTATAWDYFGKATALLGQSLILNGGFRGLPNKSDNQFDSVYDAPTAAHGSDNSNYIWNASADYIASKDTVLEARYVHATENDVSTAQFLLNDRPLTIDPNNLQKYGAYSDPARNSGNTGYDAYQADGETFKRDEVKLTASYFLDIGSTQNQIKIGGGAEFDGYTFQRPSNGWGTLIYSSATEVRARYYTTTSKQVGAARTYSFFLQDSLTAGQLSVTAGVLLNREDFSQTCLAGTVCGPTTTPPTVNTGDTRYNFLNFNWGDEVQPRLGLAYNANLIEGDKFYGSWGIYQGIDAKSAIRSQAPFRVREDQSFFSLATGAFLREQIRGSSAGHQIPPNLTAPSYQEWVFGYAAPVGREFSVDLFYQYKNLKNPLEDTPIDPANYFGSFVLHNFPNAKRIYSGATLDITKRYSHGWYLNANYTYSKLYGNFDDDFGLGQFNNSSSLEDEPGLYTDDPASLRSGLLGQDRPHIFKMLASYDLPFGFTLGGFLRVQSGTPWQAEGHTASNYVRYLEPAGSRRLPTWTNFDLLGAYTFKFGGDMSVRLEGRIQNLFDTQTVLSVNRLQYSDPYVDPPTGSAANLGPQQTKQPNALFGTPTSWAAPRRFVLTAYFDF